MHLDKVNAENEINFELNFKSLLEPRVVEIIKGHLIMYNKK